MIQYFHNRDRFSEVKGTVALEVPNKAFMERLFTTHSNKTMFMVGISVKSEKDPFVKKVGRSVAQSRMTPVVFTLDGVRQDGTTHVYDFINGEIIVNNKSYVINLSVTTVAESDKIKLISAYIEPKPAPRNTKSLFTK